jgi:hypothetical protein
MTFEIFKESIGKEIPNDLNIYLEALWHDAKGDWNKAHHIIQDMNDNNAAWIHAYLHRKEDDIANADYWYSRAGKKRPSLSLQQEWESLVKEFLDER